MTVLGHKLFYRFFGEPRRGTVLCLHGGPGATHDYILPLADLAQSGYRVVSPKAGKPTRKAKN